MSVYCARVEGLQNQKICLKTGGSRVRTSSCLSPRSWALSWITVIVLLDTTMRGVIFLRTSGFVHQISSRRNRYWASYSSSTTSLAGSSSSESPSKDELLRSCRKLALAPMMDYTDRHFRHMIRLLSRRTVLYTEMVAANAISWEWKAQQAWSEGDNAGDSYDDHALRRFLQQSPLEEKMVGPTVLQLGGNDPDALYASALAAIRYGPTYAALNLNCGCPSPKVAGKGAFGAALMRDPVRVAECCVSMHEGASKTTPVTVKCRLGTDLDWADDGVDLNLKTYLGGLDDKAEEAEYQRLAGFVDAVHEHSNGIVQDFQVHARVAVLNKKFSPADNRNVPPLKYHHVHRLAKEFPHLRFVLNGGVDTLDEVNRHLSDDDGRLDGVMVGRALASRPWSFANADAVLYGGDDELSTLSDPSPLTRWQVLQSYGEYADAQEAEWGTVIRRLILKPLQFLFAGERNAKRWRIELDRVGGLPKVGGEDAHLSLSRHIADAALKHLDEEILHRPAGEKEDDEVAEALAQQAKDDWNSLRDATKATGTYGRTLLEGTGTGIRAQ